MNRAHTKPRISSYTLPTFRQRRKHPTYYVYNRKEPPRTTSPSRTFSWVQLSTRRTYQVRSDCAAIKSYHQLFQWTTQSFGYQWQVLERQRSNGAFVGRVWALEETWTKEIVNEVGARQKILNWILILSSKQTTNLLEGEEDDEWEWDAETKQVRLLKDDNQTSARNCEEHAPILAAQQH